MYYMPESDVLLWKINKIEYAELRARGERKLIILNREVEQISVIVFHWNRDLKTLREWDSWLPGCTMSEIFKQRN